MIHRRFDSGELLDIAGLNTIRVLLDRSETARTGTGLLPSSTGSRETMPDYSD